MIESLGAGKFQVLSGAGEVVFVGGISEARKIQGHEAQVAELQNDLGDAEALFNEIREIALDRNICAEEKLSEISALLD
jgi:hypothetical protein